LSYFRHKGVKPPAIAVAFHGAVVRQPQPTAPEKTANAYSVLFGSKLGAVDALVVADDGRVFESIAAYEADGSPLCDLADADPRAAIVARLLAAVPA
jgi:hypothetical protein